MPSLRARRSSSSGQSTAEYAVLIATVIGAMVTIQSLVVRALNARYKTLIDGAVKATGTTATHYEPYYASGESISRQDSTITTSYGPGGQMTKTENSSVKVESGKQSVGTDLTADNDWQ